MNDSAKLQPFWDENDRSMRSKSHENVQNCDNTKKTFFHKNARSEMNQTSNKNGRYFSRCS